SEGLAFNITIPPNLWQQSCYQQLEKKAARQHKGIWHNAYYQPVDARRVNKDTLGFRLLRGTIQDIHESRKSFWLELNTKVSLRIDKRDLKYFKDFSPKNWKGRTVIAKGWISYYKKRYSMRIKHAAALSFL
ncbi:MAG: hypothetical protein R3240_11555, partial [Gammaproteobacteria bacterium]|nr:hypothetical protein [Gammaproteobacteria bacterium]